MANENLKIDGNTRWVLGAVTNDGLMEIRNARVNPITGALLVEANITSNNTQIGSTIPGGTAGSVLFLDVGGTLAEDNPNFFYDSLNHFLGLGTDTPGANLHVVGSMIFDLGGDSEGDIYYRNAGGEVQSLPIGTTGQILTVSGAGVPAWTTGAAGSGYTQIQDDGMNVAQETILNFVNYFTITDNPGNLSTDVDLNVIELGSDITFVTTIANNADFIDALVANTYFTTELANNANFINTLTANSLFQSNLTTFINNNTSISIDLLTQVTGILPVANGGTGTSTLTGVLHGNGTSPVTAIPLTNNGSILIGDGSGEPTTYAAFTSSTGVLRLSAGGTGAALSDPGFNAAYVWDDTTNATRLAALSGLSYNSGTNTLTASGSTPTVTLVRQLDDFLNGYLSGTIVGNNNARGISALNWTGVTNSGNQIGIYISSVTNHPGILRIEGTGSNMAAIFLGDPDNTIYPISQYAQSGNEYNFIVRCNDTTSNTNAVQIKIGPTTSILSSSISNNETVVIFDTTNNDIIFSTRDASTTQSTTINASFTAIFYNIRVVYLGTSVECYLDGVLVATHSTNIPSVSVSGSVGILTNTGEQLDIDYFGMTYQAVR